MSMQVTGFKELGQQLDRLSRATGKAAMRRALQNAAKPMLSAAIGNAPYDAGNAKKRGKHLRDTLSISTKLNRAQTALEKEEGRSQVYLYLGAGAPHAHLVEFGTRKSRPRPFLRPAFDAHKQAVLDRLKDELWKEVNKSIKRMENRAARKASK